MNLKIIETTFAVCKVESIQEIEFSDPYLFFGKTDEEISVVCSMDKVPKTCLSCEKGFRGFRIQGELDFSLVGILAEISGILAKNKISIFAISTFNTDYVLVREESFESALQALKDYGYSILL